MSDEPDGNSTGDTPGGGAQTAVVTRPQRPTGKRSRQLAGADVDEDTGSSAAVDVAEQGLAAKVRAAKKSVGPAVKPIAFVYSYLKQVVAEMRKVIWPNRKQMLTYTSVVLVFLAFMVALIGLADLGLARLVLLVFG